MGLIRMLVQPIKSSACSIAFYVQKCTNPPRSLLLLSLPECQALTICNRDSQYFKNMAQEVSDFLRDRTIGLSMSSVKMNKTAAAMEFERAAEYVDLIQAIGILPDQAGVMANLLQNRDVFVLCGQGLDVCRSSLCIR